ncbi:MAG: biotin operon repressor, partial [Candidatus Omnitrophota bacterium]
MSDIMLEKVIHYLKQTDGYLSGEEVSRSLNISRAGIWKYIQELRKEGYDIVAVPHLGYKLMSYPDKLFPREIQFKLSTKKLGSRIIYHETVTSTMDEGFKLGMEQAPEGT